MPYVFNEHEQDSIAARLAELYVLPARIFDIPVPDGPEGQDVTSIKVKLRLLNDVENQQVARYSDRYGDTSRMLAERRVILAHATMWIEEVPIKMPDSMINSIRESTGSEPSDIDQKLWVFEHCQSDLLQMLIRCYDELRQDQYAQIDEIKKKYERAPVKSPPETSSSEPSS